jgi:hypothetical protein
MSEDVREKYAHLPRDRAGLGAIQFDLPRLNPDSPRGCPCPIRQVKRYARMELDLLWPKLRFIRSAEIDGVKYWLWLETSQRAEIHDFVYVEQFEDSILIGCDAKLDLEPEQFLMWEFLRSQVDWDDSVQKGTD